MITALFFFVISYYVDQNVWNKFKSIKIHKELILFVNLIGLYLAFHYWKWGFKNLIWKIKPSKPWRKAQYVSIFHIPPSVTIRHLIVFKKEDTFDNQTLCIDYLCFCFVNLLYWLLGFRITVLARMAKTMYNKT